MAVSIPNLKKQLMSRIDTNDLVQVEKVERYINLVNSIRRINRIIKSEGESITTENGPQRFTKAHPLIGERNKINSALLSIERSFDFELLNTTDYSADDLI
ncbi:P27 family phage terminase small subunit [Cytobacillus luteolus]|uniref:P27 family phage terminase small subunit n=1 Tax=Litchfieldia luteola TaxID=682179 RepID=UPI001AE1323D|nr:P27 family phage terminase small subunit [Cytobacillus luteolus]